MASSLPLLCITEIFENLQKSLHSCILVNRYWCEHAMPILWRDPFQVLPYNRSIPLINTYLSCFSEKELNELFYGDNTLVSKYINFTSNRPLFNYPLYLKTLNISRIGGAIQCWLLTLCSIPTSEDYNKGKFEMGEQQRHFLKTFCRFFTSHSQTIFNILVDISIKLPEQEISRVPDIFTHSNARISLSHLRSVGCRGMFDKTGLLQFVGKTSSVLTKLYVSIIRTLSEIEALVDLINVQKRLKYVTLEYCFDSPNGILRSLTTRKETLVKVELIGGKFDLRDLGSLLECYHLRTLKIIECNMLELDDGVSLHDLVSKIEETYKNVNLDKLHNIVLRECAVFGCLLALFFKSGNVNIREVEVIGLMTSETNEIIDAISRYCVNLREFRVSIDQNQKYITRLFTLLESCQSLEYLLIDSLAVNDEGWLDNRETEVDANVMLPSLASFMPCTMKTLIILSNWLFSLKALNAFFCNCKAKLEYIGFGHCEFITDQHLEIFVRYAQKNKEGIGMLKTLDVDGNGYLSVDALENARKYMDVIGIGHAYNEVKYEGSSIWGFGNLGLSNSESNPFETDDLEMERQSSYNYSDVEDNCQDS